ncbi:hypothetical protein [Geminicoccus roseus]|uniref:hypothetical protein n=1 Tax=Geminicoccus roseus TaxID=404900 RepID=UPI0012FBD9DD|nr:hypothetical protein [Geminicoccus roseus]
MAVAMLANLVSGSRQQARAEHAHAGWDIMAYLTKISAGAAVAIGYGNNWPMPKGTGQRLVKAAAQLQGNKGKIVFAAQDHGEIALGRRD